MNLPYFYEENIQGPVHTLTEETSRHCVQVLRMKNAEQLQLTDGKGNLFFATISDANKKHCKVVVDNLRGHVDSAPGTKKVCIAISLLKNPSRFEWFLEKAAEIGVAEIIPLICEHTEKENFRYERMNNILISAMLQSRQTWLCELRQPEKFDDAIDSASPGLKLIAHCAEEKKENIADMARIVNNVCILIGPEGDFSRREIQAATEKNFIPVSLGNTRLRSETAGLVAATLLMNERIRK
ncbi:MAG TPA: RsmE family RNA methyltransferase [Parafilimonas sp.]|nr:RsmE family RNA methyltransferase [Parafilimonas sp.]